MMVVISWISIYMVVGTIFWIIVADLCKGSVGKMIKSFSDEPGLSIDDILNGDYKDDDYMSERAKIIDAVEDIAINCTPKWLVNIERRHEEINDDSFLDRYTTIEHVFYECVVRFLWPIEIIHTLVAYCKIVKYIRKSS